MPLYGKMKSPLGYQNLTNSFLDSYGVDHSGFTTRDELEYQFARQERENLLMDQEKQNGVTDHFTQYGHNFWGTPSENNYGFGSSNISENIERLSKQFMTPPSSSTSFLDQSLIEEPQLTGSLLDTPVGYQSLLDDSSNNFLEESSGYPSSSYNSMALGIPQSLGHSSVRAPATTSLTGGLSQNTFGTSLNNFSYPNAFDSSGGTLTERMAATLKARETPYESLSGDTTSSMSELSSDGYNSSLSSDFSNNNPHQNDPVWQKLSSYSIDQLNELGELIKKAKEEERLYGSSPIKQSLFNLLGGIKQAHAGTLSSQGINNEPTGVSMPSDEVLRADFEVYWPKMQDFENTVPHPYIDSNCYDTAGTGHLMNLKDLKNDPLIDFSDPKKREAYLALSNKIKKEICEQGADGKWHTTKTHKWQSDKFKDLENYPVDEKTDKEIAFKHIKNRLPQVLKLFSIQNPPIDWDSLPAELKIPWFDIMVNPGVNTPIYNFKTHKTGWPKLANAYATGDWETAKKELDRDGVQTWRTDELAKFIEAGRKKLNQ